MSGQGDRDPDYHFGSDWVESSFQEKTIDFGTSLGYYNFGDFL